jgi:1-carboxybiuret hydrolase subunit AtzG-like protein
MTKSATKRRVAVKAGSKAARRVPRPKAKSQSDPIDRLIEASASALALTIEPAWKSSVRTNLQVIFAQAALFCDFELPDDAEPAPIFKA